MAVANSFTAVGIGTTSIFVRHKDSFTYDVSGTFVGTVVLKKSLNGGMSWQLVSEVAAITGSASGTVLCETSDKSAALFIFECTAFTSGTIVTSLADAVKVLKEFTDEGGNPIFQIKEDGVKIFGNVVATGSSSGVGVVEFTHGADIASATTTNLEAATGNIVDVTGTTTITAITLSEGHVRIVRFTGALTLTNGASLVLPGAANITTVAGDYAIFVGYASSVVRCISYVRGSGFGIGSTLVGFVSGAGSVSASDTLLTAANKFDGNIAAKQSSTGVIDASDAAAGKLGEVASISRLQSAAASISTGTSANVTAAALSLTAGDWDLDGVIDYLPDGTTVVTNLFGAISKTSATLPGGDTAAVPTAGEVRVNHAFPAGFVPGSIVSVLLPRARVSISATTSFYLIARTNFSVSTMTVYGSLSARRVR